MKSVAGWFRRGILHDEDAQDTLEYVITVGIVVVVMVFALLNGFPSLVQTAARATCGSVDTATPTPTPTTCVVTSTP